MNYRKTVALWVLGTAGLMLGCSHHKDDEMASDESASKPRHVSSAKEEDFPDEDQIRQIDKFAGVQAAAGAQDDSTLHLVHFTGNRLNSLGESKINLMMQNHHPEDSMTIYLDMPQDMSQARRSSVEKYMAGMGVAPERVKVAAGINPQSTTPSALGVQGLERTDSEHQANSGKAINLIGITQGGSTGSNTTGGSSGK
jgi:hypothetical protein